MITVTRGSVNRIVPEEDVRKWAALGFLPEGGLPEEPDAVIDIDVGSGEVSPEPSRSEDELKSMTVAELRVLAKDAGIQGAGNMNKATLIAMILNH